METYEQELASKLAEAKRTREYKVNKGVEGVKELFSQILADKLEQALANRESSVNAYGYDPSELSTEVVKTLIKLSEEDMIYGVGVYIHEVFTPYLDSFVVRYHKNVYDEWRLSFEFMIKD